MVGFSFFSAYADDNESVEKNKPIPQKIVPDRKINDKNTFMGDFGFPTKEEIKLNIDPNAPKTNEYDDVKLQLQNRWSYKNIWSKNNLYIEGILSGGILAYNYFAVNQSDAVNIKPFTPYGSISLKFMGGSIFSPELKIQDSRFIFSEPAIKLGETTSTYNYYYLKLPLGFSIPFFGYKAQAAIDGSYSSLNSSFKIKRPVMTAGQLVTKDNIINSSARNWNVRLYLNTPVVLEPSIVEHAYFGVFYDENTSPRTSNTGLDYAGNTNMILNTLARSGGFFYDMKQDLYKGLMFGIQVNVGFADIEIVESSAYYKGVKYDNTKGLISYKASLSLGYEYIFKKNHVGLGFDIGAEYAGYVPFFFPKQESYNGLRLDGDLKYFMELKIIFGY